MRCTEVQHSSQGMESIRSAPEEVLVEIFLAFVALWEEHSTTSQGPILIGSVCRWWRAVTFSAPRLWTRIHFTVRNSSGFANAGNLVQLFTARSGVCSLHLSICVEFHRTFWAKREDSKQCRSLVDALAASVERWRCVEIHCPREFVRRIERALSERYSWSLLKLEKLVIMVNMLDRTWPGYGLTSTDSWEPVQMFANSPRLRYLALSSKLYDNDVVQLPWHQIEHISTAEVQVHNCMRIMRLCPNATQCTKLSLWSRGDSSGASLGPTSYQLRSLDICFNDCDGIGDFFRVVELPSLLDLRVEFRGTLVQDLAQIRPSSFCSTSPALRRLVFRPGHMLPKNVHSILKDAPSGLVELEIWMPTGVQSIFSNELLNELTIPASSTPECGSPTLLPNLHSLSLIGEFDVDPISFTAMIQSRIRGHVNASRGASLQSLHIYILATGKSLKIEDFGEVKGTLAGRADIQVVSCTPKRSPIFPDLL